MVEKESIKKSNKCIVRKKYNSDDYKILISCYIMTIVYPFIMFKLLKNYNPILLLLSILIINGGIIMFYFYSYLKKFGECAIYNDPMNRKVFRFPIFNFAVSHWPILHFILFAIGGFMVPQYWKHLIIIGIVWEIIESIMKVITTKKNKKIKSKRVRIDDNTVEYTTYWDSSFKDIIFNSTGVLCGIFLRSVISKKK